MKALRRQGFYFICPASVDTFFKISLLTLLCEKSFDARHSGGCTDS